MKQKMLINGCIVTVETESTYSYKPTHEDYVEITTIDKVVKTGDGEYDFIIEKEPIETIHCDRKQFIESFKDLVGVKNIVAKASLPGNAQLLHQVDGQYVDVPSIPSDSASKKEIITAGQKAAAEAGYSLTEDALKAMMDKAIKDALAAQQAQQTKTTEGGNQ